MGELGIGGGKRRKRTNGDRRVGLGEVEGERSVQEEEEEEDEVMQDER